MQKDKNALKSGYAKIKANKKLEILFASKSFLRVFDDDISQVSSLTQLINTVNSTKVYNMLSNEDKDEFTIEINIKQKDSFFEKYISIHFENDGKDSDGNIIYEVIASDISDYVIKTRELKNIYKTSVKAATYIFDDKDLTICEANDNYYEMLGYSKDEYINIIKNKSARTIYLPDKEAVCHELKSLAVNEIFSKDIRIIKKDGTLLWTNIKIIKLFTNNKKQPSYFCTFTDVNDFKKKEIEFNTQTGFMELISESIDGGTKITYEDKKRTFAYVGKDILNFLGYTKEDFMRITGGNMYNMICDEDADEVMGVIDQWFLDSNYYEVEYRIRKSDGSYVWVMDKGNRVVNENGETICISIVVDIDNTRKLIDKLESSNNEMQKLQNSIPGYFGKVAFMKDYFVVFSGNKPFYEILQIDTNERKHKYTVNYDILGIDVPVFYEIALTKQETFSFEFNDLKTGNWFMVNGTSSGEYYEDKYLTYFITLVDITNQKESAYQIQIQQEKYKIISELSEDIVFEYDYNTDIMLFVDKYKWLFARENVYYDVRKKIENNIKDENAVIDFAEMFCAIDGGLARYEGEFYLPVHGNERKWFSITATGICNDENKLVKVVGALRDVDKQKKEQQKLLDQSRIDSMTKLLNKMTTEEEISRKVEELQVGCYGVLMMIDIDDFKSINDNYGHLAGDTVITKIATKLKKTFRSDDVVGRIGGDEFQVYMTDVLDSKIAYEKAEYICSYVKTMFDGTELEGKVTVSIGAMCVDKPMKYKEMYQKADVALYNAKENGKDRYEIFGQKNIADKLINSKKVITKQSVNINNNLVINTIEIMFSNRKMEDNIRDVFEYIGYAFSIDRIVIYEKNYDNTLVNTKYEWINSDNKDAISKINQSIPLDNFVALTGNGVHESYYCNNINELPDKQRIYFAQRGVEALLQCNMVYEGKDIGYINFIEEGIKRIWNEQEIATLVVVAKLISQFIMRSKDGIIVQKQNKEKKFAMAMRETCEYLVDINVATGNYDLYIPGKNDLDSYINRGNYDDWLVEDVIQYVSQKHSKQFLDTFLLPMLMRRFASGTKEISMEYIREKDGSSLWYRRTAVLINDEGKRSVVVYVNNIDKNKKNDEEREKIEKQVIRNHLAIQNSYEYIAEIELDTSKSKVVFCKDKSKLESELNDFFETFGEYKELSVHPEDMDDFSLFYSYETFYEFYSDKSKESISTEYRIKMDEYDYSYVLATLVRIENDEFSKRNVLLMIKFISDYKIRQENKALGISNLMLRKSKEELQYRATYDVLTGIYNVQAFYEKTREILKNNKNKTYAIIRMDIDKFKLINDLYGFEEGNNVIKFAARQILEILNGKEATYCRLNADVFCMCIRYDSIENIIKCISALTEKVKKYDINYSILPYFGVCLVEDINVDITVQCDWANLALKTIKGNRLINYAMYDNKIRKSLLDERKFESEMERALGLEQFEMYLQPQYDIATSKVVAAEALVRWNYPDEGVLAPYRFIPIFEKNGFIVKLDEFIWEQACKTIHSWIEDGKEPIPISVNVSRIHIYDTKLCDKLIELTNKYNVPHHLLELELTESVYFDDADTLNRILKNLRNLGFIIAMDDFGSAYSSLNMLENIPIDILKLDRELLQKANTSTQGQTIVKYIIAMAKQLKLKVVAEGVENVEQAMLLLKSSCYIAQGFYYSKPVPLEKFENLIYSEKMIQKVDKRIKELIDNKKDFVNIVMESEEQNYNEEFINAVASFDEIDRLRQYFVDVIDKYRGFIIESNNLIFEIDISSKRVKRYDNEEMEDIIFNKIRPDNYSDLKKVLISNCNASDREVLNEMFTIETEQNALDEGLKNIGISIRLNDDDIVRKVILTFIPIGNESGVLKNLIICIKDVETFE